MYKPNLLQEIEQSMSKNGFFEEFKKDDLIKLYYFIKNGKSPVMKIIELFDEEI